MLTNACIYVMHIQSKEYIRQDLSNIAYTEGRYYIYSWQVIKLLKANEMRDLITLFAGIIEKP